MVKVGQCKNLVWFAFNLFFISYNKTLISKNTTTNSINMRWLCHTLFANARLFASVLLLYYYFQSSEWFPKPHLYSTVILYLLISCICPQLETLPTNMDMLNKIAIYIISYSEIWFRTRSGGIIPPLHVFNVWPSL